MYFLTVFSIRPSFFIGESCVGISIFDATLYFYQKINSSILCVCNLGMIFLVNTVILFSRFLFDPNWYFCWFPFSFVWWVNYNNFWANFSLEFIQIFQLHNLWTSPSLVWNHKFHNIELNFNRDTNYLFYYKIWISWKF